MKLRLWSLATALSLVLLLVTLAPPLVRKASAAAALTSITPNTGHVGDTVMVAGTGTPLAAYQILWDSLAGWLLASGSFDALGNVNMPVTIPAAPSDAAHSIWLVEVGPPLTSSSKLFGVTPALTLTTNTGNVGDSTIVFGTGFGTLETGITLTWDGRTLVAVGSADGVGNWTTTIAVPSDFGGAHTIGAYGSITVTPATGAFTVLPNLTISPTSGPAGTVLTASGTGFGVNETGINVTWDGRALIPAVTAGSLGGWTATVAVPSDFGGVHTVSVYGPVTFVLISRGFTIQPALALSSDSGPAGTMLTASGTGFGTNETGITVTWDGRTLVTVGTASSSGDWTTTIAVPSESGGTHIISASGSITVIPIVRSFTILTGLSISSASGPVGTMLTVGGAGFGANEPIELLWDGASIKAGIVASGGGTWTTTFPVPAATAGAHAIGAQGTATTAATVMGKSFTVTRSVSISPATGYVGTVVTVDGSGFAGNAAITIYYGGTSVTTTPASVRSTASGNISATFSAPATAPGAHTVVVSDGAGEVSATFTSTSSISQTITSGTVGSQTTISGLGFPPNSAVTFTFDGTTLTTTPASVTTDASGAFSASISIPEAARGTHTMRASAGVAAMTTSVEVAPKFSLTPESGTVGASVTVSGKGFGSGEPLIFTFDGLAITPAPAGVFASTTGSFTVSIVLPTLAGGPHVIKASDKAASAQATVGITSQVSIQGSSAVQVGDKIGVAGTGFPAGAIIAAAVDGAVAATSPSPLVADSRGTFSAETTVPAAAFGNHTVSFTGGGSTSQAAFSVSSSFSISPNNGNVGSVISVSGSGYAAGSLVTVTYDGSPVLTNPATLTSSAQGGFQATVTVPQSIHGQHVVAAGDAAGHSVQAPFVVESTPPLAPALLSPATESRVGTLTSQMPTFNWSPVSDPSDVTYTLQVSREPGFAPLALDKAGLAAVTYTVSGQEKLGRGYYYWRVKAVDGASNESGWSQTFTLKVGILPLWMPMWMFIVIILLGLGLIGGAASLLFLPRKR